MNNTTFTHACAAEVYFELAKRKAPSLSDNNLAKFHEMMKDKMSDTFKVVSRRSREASQKINIQQVALKPLKLKPISSHLEAVKAQSQKQTGGGLSQYTFKRKAESKLSSSVTSTDASLQISKSGASVSRKKRMPQSSMILNFKELDDAPTSNVQNSSRKAQFLSPNNSGIVYEQSKFFRVPRHKK